MDVEKHGIDRLLFNNLLSLDSTVTLGDKFEIRDLLDSDSIGYKMSDDGLEFRVLKKDQASASLLLGANDIQSYAYSIDNVTDGSFSTTESDKQKKYVLYLESRLEQDFLARFDAIESANVQLHIPDNDGTLIGNQEPSSAWIVLTP